MNPDNSVEGRGENEPEEGIELARKTSRAHQIWLAIVISVLIALYLETAGGLHSSHNFFLSGDSSANGATVIIDGKRAGVMSASEKRGMGGTNLYLQLSNGNHRVEVQKDGYEPFVKDIELRGQDILSVDLKPSSL